MEDLIYRLLQKIGEDPEREGLLKTPQRVAKAYDFLTAGYDADPKAILEGALFEAEGQNMVLVNDIDFFSMCEHHMLPFFGKAHIAYIPNGKIVGLSKLGRLVDVFARRLQVQERLCAQVADTLMEVLQPEGVGVVLHSQHLCMMMRGIQQTNSFAITSEMRGSFREDSKTRGEFLRLLGEKPYN